MVIAENAAVANQTLQEANRAVFIHEDVLAIAIQRDDRIITPRGDTVLYPGDRVKLYLPERITPDVLDVFQGPE